jgi:hypothetical protein
MLLDVEGKIDARKKAVMAAFRRRKSEHSLSFDLNGAVHSHAFRDEVLARMDMSPRGSGKPPLDLLSRSLDAHRFLEWAEFQTMDVESVDQSIEGGSSTPSSPRSWSSASRSQQNLDNSKGRPESWFRKAISAVMRKRSDSPQSPIPHDEDLKASRMTWADSGTIDMY